jgi:polyhydroxybutyrate depolymerase
MIRALFGLRWLAACPVAILPVAAVGCAETPVIPGAAASGGTAGGGATSLGGAGAASSAGAGGTSATGGVPLSGGNAGSAGSLPTAGSTTGGSMADGGSGAGGSAADPQAPEPSSGCDGASELPEGAQDIDVGDLTRSFVTRKPTGYDAKKPWPLVLALHPNGSNSSYWDVTTGARAVRPLLQNSAVLVLGQARNDDWRGDVPLDLGYFDALIAEVEARLCIDKQRIFAMGFSGGGSFAGALGCYRKDIRAIAAGGAVIYFTPADCVGTPAAWITIGDDEAVQGRLDYRDFFRDSAGCSATSSNVAPSPCVAYDCPDPERPVQFCSHVGGHEWPDFGSAAAVAFFERF